MQCRLTACMLMNPKSDKAISTQWAIKATLFFFFFKYENISFSVQEMRVQWHWPLFRHPAETVGCMAAQSRMNMALTQLTTYSAQTVNLHFISNLSVK